MIIVVKYHKPVSYLSLIAGFLFIAFLLIGAIAIIVIHSHVLAFIDLGLLPVIVIVGTVGYIKSLKSGSRQERMRELFENSKRK
ncbi:membrane protein [Cuniculiplasma divulgatum]|uniref:Membrane protein n=1 Tax=Cuniculiplasma divulgatum TaxID=1673428 RepID=A0A1N5WHR6_9ARCH|nr:membrane protein [Cuniculiplasma divulgatum]